MNFLIFLAIFCSISALRVFPDAIQRARTLDRKIIGDIKFKKLAELALNFKTDTFTYTACGGRPMRFSDVVSFSQNLPLRQADAIQSNVLSAQFSGNTLIYLTRISNIPFVSQIRGTAIPDARAPAGFKLIRAEQVC
ncbi:unnamed protein product [Caenorhabditis angaria]|uniref:Uncharacterized protein n=1 Tax=Caenorhabditis angaria TaxID=860376 RepID=A0A9P1N200_9PELO|nr:unnamed protein product [Caenorhabditis angaria]